MRLQQKLPRFCAIAAVIALIISACGSTAPTAAPTRAPTPGGATATARPTSGTTAGPTAVATATAVPAPTATALPTSSGELKIAVQSINPNIFPGVTVAGVENLTMDPMYDYLIGSKNDDSMDPDSGLIISWSANADSSVWTFKLRDNMVFHNGDRVSSADAANTLQLAINEPGKYSRGAELQRGIKQMDTPDATTLIVSLNIPDIYWQVNYLKRGVPFTASPKVIVPKNYLARVGFNEANKAPVGSGAYKFKSFLVDQQLQMEAVDRHFFFGVPKTKTLTIVAIPDESTRLALLQTGGADLAPMAQVANIKKATEAKLKLVARRGSLTWNLWNFQYPEVINGYGKNPLANEDVRKALLWYAIDRKTLVESFMPGYAAPSMDYPVFSWDIGGFPTNPVPTIDVAKAKSTLAAAGYPNGFEMDLYTDPKAPYPSAEVGEALATYWQAVGIKIGRKATPVSLQADYYQKKGYDKPVVHFSVNVTNRPLSASTALLNHNKDALFSTNADPEAFRLASAWVQAKSIGEYKAAGLAYQKYAYDHVATGVAIFVSDEIWFRNDKVSDKWDPGRDGSPSARYGYAAALR